MPTHADLKLHWSHISESMFSDITFPINMYSSPNQLESSPTCTDSSNLVQLLAIRTYTYLTIRKETRPDGAMSRI